MTTSSAHFLLSPELQEFQSSLRAFLEREFPPTKLRAAEKNNTERERFVAELSPKLTELGVYLAGAPESGGGLGAGLAASAMIAEECARALVPTPVFETLAYVIAPLSVVSSAALEEIVGSGEGIAVTVRGGFSLVGGKVSGTGALTSGALNGKSLIGICEDGAGKALAVIPTAGLNFTPVKTIDLLRPFAEVTLNGVTPLEIISLDQGAVTFIESYQSVLAAAEIVGCADKVLQMTVDYVKTRKQFGVPIGSFQAIQHKLAEIQVQVDAAKSLLRFAAWSADNDRAQFLSAASGVKAFASEHLPRAIEGCLQAHGGIGFTWEYDLHLYLRRAILMASLFGTSAEHGARLGGEALA